jgi:hypothetical protein
MNPYVRPTIVEEVFFDSSGSVIDYGAVFSTRDVERDRGVNVRVNQERYLPIFTVAEALVEFIGNEYDVAIEEVQTLPANRQSLAPRDDDSFARIIRVVPAQPNQATITLGFGREPGVIAVFAGLVAEFDMWFCGCDACDDRWQTTAESLECVILSLVSGGLTETVGRGWRGRVRYWLDRERPHEWNGSASTRLFAREHLREIVEQLSKLPDGRWAGFTVRATQDDSHDDANL